MDSSSVAIASGSGAGQESGVSGSAAVGGGLRVLRDDAGRVSDSRRKRAPFVDVSCGGDRKIVLLRGMIHLSSKQESNCVL